VEQYRGDLLHSSEYRNGDPWSDGAVLVVGFGNSACEQALDLVERGAEFHLAVRSPVNVLPRDFFGVVPVLPLGIVMQHLPTRLADALA
jgi:cation diffusion facilitator CzcD-associated flavoprotein CzcO